jgi:predicted AAA+ superfamily ATPase
LHPLTSAELGAHFDLTRAVAHGTLPSIYFSDDPRADLAAYAGMYLQQEIVAEGATRNVPAFSRFLQVSAQCNGTIVNFTKVASDAQVPRTTVHEYFEILKDTLIMRELPAWRRTRKRKPITSSKYYFFDVGVAGNLQGRPIQPGTPEFGVGLETHLLHELAAYADYRSGEPLHFWRSTQGQEVDFLIGDHTAIELKSTRNVTTQDLSGLRALGDEMTLKRRICVSLDARARTLDGIAVVPYRRFLESLWEGEYA